MFTTYFSYFGNGWLHINLKSIYLRIKST
jgi:hypothetical protein